VFRRSVLVLVALALVVPTVSAVAAGPPSFSLPDQASEVAPGVFFLGHAVEDGVVLEGYAYVRYASSDEGGRRANGKPPGTPGNGNGNGGGGGGGEEPDSSTCYSFISGGKWKTTEGYLINPANSTIGNNVRVAGTDAAFRVWETEAGINIVDSGAETGGDLSADSSSTDGLNEIYFAPISDPGVLGYTIVWSTRSRGRNVGQIVEADMVIDDDGDWTWSTDGSAATGEMDFWGVFTHEAGHWVGMGHTKTSQLCETQTMYPYISDGDSTKTDLEDGDIAGVSDLYS